MKTNLQRDGDRICSVHAAQAAMMEPAGEGITCDESERPVAMLPGGAAASSEQMAGPVPRDEGHPTPGIAPRPGSPEDGKLWSAEARPEQVRRLEAALPLEREAISAIKMALGRTETGSPRDPEG